MLEGLLMLCLVVHQRSRIQIWLYEQVNMRIEGHIIVSFTFSDFEGHLCKISSLQGWRSGESNRLPPMWPGFDSQTQRHVWVEFVGSLLCTKRFSPGTPVFPLLKNQKLI